MTRPTREEFEVWNEEMSERHDLDQFYAHPNPLFRYIEEKRIRVLLRLADIRPDHRVLEVGCGAGHILARVPAEALYGIDISDLQVAKARNRLLGRAEIRKARGESIPFPDGSFDRLICSEVIEHVLEPREVLTEMARVLKPDGLLSLSIPNEQVINRTKAFLRKTGLIRFVDADRSQGGWSLTDKDNLDEWHLHDFSLALARECIAGLFTATRTVPVPNRLFPARYVLRCRKSVPTATPEHT